MTATLRSIAQLQDAGLVPAARAAALEPVAARYALAITPAMADLIDHDDPDDPIARQFVPDPAELVTQPQERADPIGDDAHSPVEGIVHRYPDRVLLKLVYTCPVYCRFCFRREMVGPNGRAGLTARQRMAAYDYIRAHPQIWEVILTGGDPLVLPASRLRDVVETLAAIDHVKIVRIHTRVPTVAPERITADMIEAIKAPGKATYVVLHANHPRELTPAARAACAQIIDAGIPMLSQSVLLARRQRRRRCARGADARLRRVPDQAVLSPPRRSRARHRPSAHLDRRRTGADAPPARPRLRPVPAGLCARHSRRRRQGADRAAIPVGLQ